MGKRGRRPKLAAIKSLEGNPGKRPIEPIGVQGLGAPFTPDHLSDDAAGCLEIIRQSMPSQIYSALDSFLLSAFAVAWAIHKRAAHETNSPDFAWIEVNSTGTRIPSPWVRILNSQAQLLASLGDRLGLDPKSRAALKLPKANQHQDKFAGLRGRATSSSTLNS